MSQRKEFTQILYEKIKSGELVRNGKLLPERKITELMKVSRPLLRQAFAVLEAFGVLEIRGRDGIYIQKHSLKNVSNVLFLFSGWPADIIPQLFEIRSILEPQAVRLAARRRTDDDLAKMHETIRQMMECDKTLDRDYEEYAKWNKMFHSMLMYATQNQIFVRLLESVLLAFEQTTIMLAKTTVGSMREIWPQEAPDEHQNILRAITAKDEDMAEKYLTEHLDRAASRIKNLTSNFNIKLTD